MAHTDNPDKTLQIHKSLYKISVDLLAKLIWARPFRNKAHGFILDAVPSTQVSASVSQASENLAEALLVSPSR